MLQCVRVFLWRSGAGRKQMQDRHSPHAASQLGGIRAFPPTCMKKLDALPIRLDTTSMAGGGWRDPVALANFRLAAHMEYRQRAILPKHAHPMDFFAERHGYDLDEILAAHPGISFADVEKKIPEALRRSSLLQKWMVDDVNRSLAVLRALRRLALPFAEFDKPSHKLDILGLYERYCVNREAPNDDVISGSPCIGLSIAYGHDGVTQSYCSLFFWPWGQWICPLVSSLDEDGVKRALLRDVLTKAAIEKIPVVHGNQNIIPFLRSVAGHSDTCLPMFVNVIPQYEAPTHQDRIAFAMLATFGIDTLSWRVYADLSRLMEKTPKNPLNVSFVPNWKLRWEQMALLGCEGLSCISLFEAGIVQI